MLHSGARSRLSIGTVGMALLLGFGVNADAAAPPETIAKRGNLVLFQAPISIDTRNRLLAVLDSNVNAIVVNSGGGDSLPAIDIGREIRRRNLKIIVAGVC